MFLLLFALFFIFFVDDTTVHLSAHIFIYFFVAILLISSVFKCYSKPSERFFASALHIVLLLMQILFLTMSDWTIVNRIVSVVLIMISFMLEYYILGRRYKDYMFLNTNDMCLSLGDLISVNKKLKSAFNTTKKAGNVISLDIIRDICGQLTKHSSIRYLNQDCLSDEYLENVDKTIDDPFIYLVLSDTGSSASDLIGMFTNKHYNHVSISFDSQLKTLISYNGGEKVSPPGLNAEMVEWFYKKDDASIRVYRLPVTSAQKSIMIEKIKQINHEGSAYNIIGLAVKKSFKPNIMFCSQFVYGLLLLVDAQYFVKPAIEVKPTDFIELDYDRKLEFLDVVKLSDIFDETNEKTPTF